MTPPPPIIPLEDDEDDAARALTASLEASEADMEEAPTSEVPASAVEDKSGDAEGPEEYDMPVVR